MGAGEQPRLALTKPSNVPRSHYTYFIVPFGYELSLAGQSASTPLEYHRETPSEVRPANPTDKPSGTYLSILDDQEHPPLGKPLESEDLWDLAGARDAYLLPETRLTLFTRAHWFRLRQQKGGPAVLDGELTPAGTTTPITFQAMVDLVLFEFDRAPCVKGGRGPKASQTTDGTIKQAVEAVGYLLLVAVLTDQQLADLAKENQRRADPALADKQPADRALAALLDFNQRMRYLKRPYKDYRSRVTLSWPNKNPSDPDIAHGADDDYWDLWGQLIRNFVLRDGDGEPGYRLQPTDILSTDSATDGRQGGDQGARGGYPDDRAFTYILACVTGAAGFGRLGDRDDASEEYGERVWSCLLDVDGSSDLHYGISEYHLRWLKDRTYKRWFHLDTLYGYTDFSAAMLVKVNDKQQLGFPVAYYHYHLVYLDQLLLLLYERVTLYLFSAAISTASHKYFKATHSAHSTVNEQEALDSFHALRRQFTLLTNLYQFPMFSTQYQGQEMYALARKSLRVNQLYKEVETEIRATDEWLAARATERRARATDLLNERLGRIQVVGAIVAALSVGLSMVGVGLTLFQLGHGVPETLLIVLFQSGAGRSARPPHTLLGTGEYLFVRVGILLIALALGALVVYAVALLARALWRRFNRRSAT